MRRWVGEFGSIGGMRQARAVDRERADLAGRVGRLLQATRAEVGLSQEMLAELAGSSQQWVSRVERGLTNPRLGDVERLFTALGKHVVAQIVRPSGLADPDLLPADGIAAEVETLVLDFDYCWRRFRDVPYLVSGRFGALCHGLPVRPAGLDLVLAERDLEAATEALNWFSAVRWSDRNQAFTDYLSDLTAPAPRRFRTAAGYELRFSVRAELPAPVRVEAGGHLLPLLALPEILRDDPDVAALADRLKP